MFTDTIVCPIQEQEIILPEALFAVDLSEGGSTDTEYDELYNEISKAVSSERYASTKSLKDDLINCIDSDVLGKDVWNVDNQSDNESIFQSKLQTLSQKSKILKSPISLKSKNSNCDLTSESGLEMWSQNSSIIDNKFPFYLNLNSESWKPSKNQDKNTFMKTTDTSPPLFGNIGLNANKFNKSSNKNNKANTFAALDKPVANKGRHLDESHNRINIENLLNRRDMRTTIMIRHIPNKYSLKTFVEDLNENFKDKYDLFYLPIDYINNCNLGFAFINFVDPMHIIAFFNMYRGKKWTRFNSEKICELAYAKIQGKKNLINHFEKGSVMNFENKDKKPLILDLPSTLAKVRIPLSVVNAFLAIYPFSSYRIVGDHIEIDSFYNF